MEENFKLHTQCNNCIENKLELKYGLSTVIIRLLCKCIIRLLTTDIRLLNTGVIRLLRYDIVRLLSTDIIRLVRTGLEVSTDIISLV